MRHSIPFLACLGFVACSIDGVFWDIHKQTSHSPAPKGSVYRVMSVYSDTYLGRKTKYGEKYTGEGYTVASNDYRYNTRLRITYKGKSLIVRVTDTMSRVYSGKRVDASHRVWRELTGNAKPGLRRVTVEVVR